MKKKMAMIIFVLFLIFPLFLFPDQGPSLFYKSMEKSFIGIQVADIASTYYLIHKGYAEESNPMVASYINKPFIVIGIKAALTVGVLTICRKTRKQYRFVATVALIALNALGSYVIYNNLKTAR